MVNSLASISDRKIYISLIITIFNSEKYISQCLDNLIKQSLDNIEIICVDYGSVDESKKLILEYCKMDNRINFYSGENNIGAARNRGIMESNGEYLLFLNSQDWMYTNSCERLQEELIKSPCDILFFKSSLFNEDNDKIYTNPIDFNLDIIHNLVGDNVFNFHDLSSNVFSLPIIFYNNVFNRQFLLNFGLFFSEMGGCEFYLFFEMILKAKKLKIINKHIYIKRELNEKFDITYFKQNLYHLDKLVNFFRKLENYNLYEKQLLNFIIGNVYDFYLNSNHNDKVYLLIREYFITIKEDKYSYVRYISNLDNKNLFFFRDVLTAKTNSEYCLLIKYNQLLNENGMLNSEISKLKKEINQLEYQLSFFE